MCGTNDTLFSDYHSFFMAKETPICKCGNRCLFIQMVNMYNIDKQHRLTVLYHAKIIKNKDVNYLGTNILYTILFKIYY